MKLGFFILTKTPHKSQLNFVESLRIFHPTIYSAIVVDDNEFNFDVSSKSKKSKDLILQVDDDLCYDSGYKNANFIIRKKVTSWDKVLYLLNNDLKNIDFAFIVEDDVFVPSITSVKNMFKKYKNYDCVTATHNSRDDDRKIQKDSKNSKSIYTPWCHWDKTPKAIKREFQRHSMVCAIGLSRNLLNVIADQVDSYKELFFIEIMFNSLAEENELNIFTPPEFSTILWRKSWVSEDFIENPENWFHPVKDLEEQVLLRKMLRKLD